MQLYNYITFIHKFQYNSNKFPLLITICCRNNKSCSQRKMRAACKGGCIVDVCLL